MTVIIVKEESFVWIKRELSASLSAHSVSATVWYVTARLAAASMTHQMNSGTV